MKKLDRKTAKNQNRHAANQIVSSVFCCLSSIALTAGMAEVLIQLLGPSPSWRRPQYSLGDFPVRSWHSKHECFMLQICLSVKWCSGYFPPSESLQLSPAAADLYTVSTSPPTPGAEPGQTWNEALLPRERNQKLDPQFQWKKIEISGVLIHQQRHPTIFLYLVQIKKNRDYSRNRFMCSTFPLKNWGTALYSH